MNEVFFSEPRKNVIVKPIESFKPKERNQADTVLISNYVWDGFKLIFAVVDYFKSMDNSILSESLDWNRDLGISEDSQASTGPLEIQTCFSCNSIVFHINPKRFLQNQKDNRTKYFAKIS